MYVCNNGTASTTTEQKGVVLWTIMWHMCMSTEEEVNNYAYRKKIIKWCVTESNNSTARYINNACLPRAHSCKRGVGRWHYTLDCATWWGSSWTRKNGSWSTWMTQQAVDPQIGSSIYTWWICGWRIVHCHRLGDHEETAEIRLQPSTIPALPPPPPPALATHRWWRECQMSSCIHASLSWPTQCKVVPHCKCLAI